jgi:hypothetical protein
VRREWPIRYPVSSPSAINRRTVRSLILQVLCGLRDGDVAPRHDGFQMRMRPNCSSEFLSIPPHRRGHRRNAGGNDFAARLTDPEQVLISRSLAIWS